MNNPNGAIDVTLYELSPSRSVRCQWTLRELDLAYTSISDPSLMHSEELVKIHPLGKLPAAVINGKPLFESAAICTYLADLVPEKELIAPTGTWERGLHDQWISFCLTEMEAYLWSTARNTLAFIQPKEKHVTAIVEQNNEMLLLAATVLDKILGDTDYLVGSKFSVTDIIVGLTVNWGNSQGLIGDLPNLLSYRDRLLERTHCPLK